MTSISQTLIQLKATAKNVFWPDVEDQEYLLAAKKRLIGAISLLAGGVGVLSGAVSFSTTMTDAPFISLFGVFGPLAALAAPAIAHKRRNVDFGGFVLIFYLLIHITLVTLSHHGLMWPTAIYLAAVPLLATLILGYQKGIFISLLTVSDLVMLSMLTVPGWVGFTLITLILGSTIATSIFQAQMNNTTRALIILNNEAHEANQAKSELLANVSHEIRTPLNGVIGILQLFHDSNLSEDQKHLLDIGTSSANNLLIILNDILDYSKIEANGIQLEKITFNRDQIVDSVFSTMFAIAKEKGVCLRLDIDESIPARLIGDPLRLQQVVTNFVSNAIKFTEEGDVSVRMERGSFEGEIKISVTDTGIGMSQEACSRIFEKFQQAEESTTRKFGGTGLGLAIAKRLVELHGGKIGVISSPGNGSTFWFTFPLVEGDELRSEISIATKFNRITFPHAKILIAEDNRTNRLIVKRLIEKFGVSPTMAEDGVEAVNASEAEKYDLIFMDIQMPNMDGIKATKEIRRKGRINAKTPIIALSANVMTEQKMTYLRSGMTTCLEKPVKLDALWQIMNEYLDAKSADYFDDRHTPSSPLASPTLQ